MLNPLNPLTAMTDAQALAMRMTMLNFDRVATCWMRAMTAQNFFLGLPPVAPPAEPEPTDHR